MGVRDADVDGGRGVVGRRRGCSGHPSVCGDGAGAVDQLFSASRPQVWMHVLLIVVDEGLYTPKPLNP